MRSETTSSPERRAAAARRLLSFPSLLKALAAVTVALVIGVAATGGTYALWSKSSSVAASTISSGSAIITVGTLSPSSAVTLYPGVTSFQSATITNTGSTTLALNLQSLVETSTATGFSSALSFSVGTVASAVSCATGFSGAWTGALGAVTTAGTTHPDLASSLVSGGTVVLCVAVTLPGNAPASSQVAAAPAFSLTLGGTS